MQGYRRKLGQAYVALIGTGAGFTSGDKPPELERKGSIVYGVIASLAILLSIAIVAIVSVFSAEIALAIIWGLLIGWAFLLFFPAKAVATFFGAFVAVGLSDLANLTLAIEKSANLLDRIARALLGPGFVIYPAAYWLFLAIIVVMCLPAYWEKP